MRTIGIDIRLIGKQRTGDEVVFFHLTKNVLAQDTENQYELFTDERNPEKLALLRAKLECVGNTRVTFVSLPGSNRFLWNLFSVPLRLLRHPIDIYYTQYIAPFWLPKQTKLFTHIHDVSFQVHPEWIGRFDRFFLSLLIPRSLARSRFILVPSEFTRQEVLRLFPQISPDRVSLVSNAVDPQWLEPVSSEAKEQIRQELGLAFPYMVSVGTMQPRKNIAFLLEAFQEFRKENEEALLVLVGNPNGHHVEKAVQEAARSKMPGVIFSGYLSDQKLRALVAGSRGVVFPSLYEGFGLPLLEGFAAGVPVAASDIIPFHEIGREAVFFFDPTSIAELQKALYTLFIDANRPQALVALGQKQLLLFDWGKSAHQFIQLCNQA